MSAWNTEFPAIAAALAKARRNHRTGQAYLFVGDNSAQLEAFALGWARTAACLTETANGDACGQCRNCRLFDQGEYSECYRLAPQSKSRIITTDAMREFDRQLSLSAPPGMLKVGVIQEADCMGVEAQNAFLKTLEEPPPGTMLILTTTLARRLLPTIRSRCQTVLLLHNRTDYSKTTPADFLDTLATMRRGAGTRVAFNAVAAFTRIFGSLHQQAETTVSENWDPQWDEAAGNDSSLRKRLAEQKLVKTETEYLRLRGTLLDALLAWFQQRYLLAAGTPDNALPQPEFRDRMARSATPSLDEAEEDIRNVQTYLHALHANVTEEIALNALCLSICRK